jgi:hypothetical protein
VDLRLSAISLGALRATFAIRKFGGS